MIYIGGFALTFIFALVFESQFGNGANVPLTERGQNGLIFHRKQIRLTLLFVLTSLPLFLISALRKGIGTDYYYTYFPRFQEILHGERTYYEIGFYWFNRLVGFCTQNAQWIFVITSLIFCVFVFLAFYQNAEDLPFCVVMLMVSGTYFASLNNLRQALASALILFGYKYIKEKKWIPFILLTIAVATLHKSMLIFLAVLVLFWVMQHINEDKLLIVLSVGAMAVWIVLMTNPGLLQYVLPSRLAYYVKHSIYTTRTIGVIQSVLNLAVFVFLYYTRSKSGDKQMTFFVLVQYLAVLVCLFDPIIPAAYRIMRLFTFWQLLSVPIAVNHYSGTKCKLILKIAIGAVFGVLCVYSIVIRGAEQILPYHSIFG